MSQIDLTRNRSGMAPARTVLAPTDSELLLRFHREGDESAFRTLVEKHAAMVFAVCRQVLRMEADVDDACQATFVILAQRAATLKKADSLASWLYRVAYRAALAAAKRRVKERAGPLEQVEQHVADDAFSQICDRETNRILHEELSRLPSRYRAALVLFYLEDRKRGEVADELECTDAAVKSRLSRARELLRQRLMKRGIGLSVALTGVSLLCRELQASPQTSILVEQCTRAAVATDSTTAPLSDACQNLVHQELNSMVLNSIVRPSLLAACVALLFVVGWTGGVFSATPDEEKDRQSDPQYAVVPSPPGDTTDAEAALRLAAKDVSTLDVVPTSVQATAGRRKIRAGDRLGIAVAEVGPQEAISGGVFRVESTGEVALGPTYGRIQIENLDVEEAGQVIREHLRQFVRTPGGVIVTFDRLPGQADSSDAQVFDDTGPIRIGERLRIRVGGDDSLSPEIDEVVRVESTGKIPVPYFLTRMDVASKSIEDVEETLLKKVDGIFRNARVLITREPTDMQANQPDLRSELRQIRKDLEKVLRRL